MKLHASSPALPCADAMVFIVDIAGPNAAKHECDSAASWSSHGHQAQSTPHVMLADALLSRELESDRVLLISGEMQVYAREVDYGDGAKSGELSWRCG